MNTDLIARYTDLRVPRYTSYPTAPHFTSDVGPARYRAWLGAIAPMADASLYLHVPFCNSLCWYCGCNTKVVARYDPVATYVGHLIGEIDLIGAAVPGGLTVRHVHWGGGTPTILSPDDFERVMARLRHHFAFAPSAEVAVEIDPRSLDDAMISALARAGVTRASLGVQDFDPAVQQKINRIQPFETTAAVAEKLRGVGITALNLDLMYGLPGQTVNGCAEAARRALVLDPGRLAVFGYAHVPWMKTHQRLINEAELPGTEERWRQFAAIADTLVAAGFSAIGLDHFAAPGDELSIAVQNGTLRRNFQGYTTDTAEVLLGLGASAIGSLPQGYIQSATDWHAYGDAIAGGEPATVRGLAIDADDRLRRAVIERLMCDLSVRLDQVAADHGTDPAVFDADLTQVEPLVRDGIAEVDGYRITVREEARQLVRAVAAAFDRYVGTGQARHSKAI